MGKKRRSTHSDEEDGGSSDNAAEKSPKKSKKEDRRTTAEVDSSKFVKKPKFGQAEKEQHVTVHRNAEGDSYIDLGRKRRATARSFKGAVFLDIREYYGPDDDEKPGKKGISLTIEQWKTLKESQTEIDELLAGLRK